MDCCHMTAFSPFWKKALETYYSDTLLQRSKNIEGCFGWFAKVYWRCGWNRSLIIDDGCTDETAQVARDWGVDYIVKQRQNKGLAKGFMAGLDACLKNGADIIVNTDADNQYCGADIEKLVRPIIELRSHIVIGARPIEETERFSPLKKKLQL